MSIRNLPAPASNVDPPLVRESFNVAAADHIPSSGHLITAINVATSGTLYLLDIAGNSIGEFFNAGWNPCTAATKIKNHASNTVTAGVCKLSAIAAST